MNCYKVLVVDDELSSNRELYKHLFEGDSDFQIETAESWSSFVAKKLGDFDVILLEVNLDHWGKTLRDAFPVVDQACPVVLVSQSWIEPRTHRHIFDALASAKQVSVVGTLALNDLGASGWESHAIGMRSQLRLVVARHSQHGTLDLGPGDPIRILHLSDPQYGDPSEDNLAFLVEREVPSFVRDDLRLNVHFLAITGDVTFSGQPHEFLEAQKKLQKLAEAFLPNRDDWRERILIVPGNHDVDLRMSAADWIDFDFGIPNSIRPLAKTKSEDHRTYALQAFRDFAWRLSGNPYWRDANELLWINDSFRHLGIRFYILNTVSTTSFAAPKKYEVPTGVLTDMVDHASVRDNLFGIVLAHHGPSDSSNAITESIANWEQVVKSLQQAKVRLFLHGHGHQRLADIVSLEEGVPLRKAEGCLASSDVLRVMAPTTHLNGSKRPPSERRGFNLVTLYRKHGRVERVEIDTYDLSGNEPHRAQLGPWTVRV